MALLTEAQGRSLYALTGKESYQRWQGMEKKLKGKEKITIANTGLVNSGKSSLFNALLDAFEEARFPVGAVRTTVHGDREPLNSWVDIVDTPGIDAADEDDDTAFSTLMEADLMVVTHNVKIGMLNRSEYEWLRRLAGGMSTGELRRRVIVACTWIDERDRQEEYESVIGEIQRQVREALGTEVPLWKVSAKRYFAAHERNKEALAQASNIPQFKSFLLQRAGQIQESISADRRKELNALCEDTRKLLLQQRSALLTQVQQAEERTRRQYQPAFALWASKLKNFVSMREAVRGKLSQIKNESDSSYDARQFAERIEKL